MRKDKTIDFDFEHDMEIDPDALDVACLEQANLHAKYGRLCAEKEDLARKAQENIKTIRSELILEAKRDDSVLDGAKATDPTVEAYYRTHPRYIKAKKLWVEKQKEADLARAMVFSVQQRGRMLDLLVELLKSEYFDGPVSPMNLSKRAIDEQRRKKVVDKALKSFHKYGVEE